MHFWDMNQQYLFKEEVNIPGLQYISSYISSEYAEELLKLIDSQNWNLDLKRRTQHYGYKYDYTARSVDPSYYLGEMPYWIDELCNKLCVESIFYYLTEVSLKLAPMPSGLFAPVISTVCTVFCFVVYYESF